MVEVGRERSAVSASRHVANPEVRHHRHSEPLHHDRGLPELERAAGKLRRGMMPEGLPVAPDRTDILAPDVDVRERGLDRVGEAAAELETELTQLAGASILQRLCEPIPERRLVGIRAVAGQQRRVRTFLLTAELRDRDIDAIERRARHEPDVQHGAQPPDKVGCTVSRIRSAWASSWCATPRRN